MRSSELKVWIRERSVEQGFDRVRFCDAGGSPGIEAFDHFIDAGHHASMGWLAKGRALRADPAELLPGLKSAAVLALDYGGPAPGDPGPGHGRVSRYAWGRDYHNIMSKRLRRLCRDLRAEGVGCYWSADTRPVLERAWAERSGLGFIGKNCCAIVPGQGSFFFIAVVFLDVQVDADAPIAGWTTHCGSCRRCLDACPTGAFTAPGQLDARRCVSYLTIEHSGPIAPDLARGMGRMVLGCDICQDVCPHNHRPRSDVFADLLPRDGHAWLDLAQILATPDAEFDERFRGSALRRPGANGLKRNARIALHNSSAPRPPSEESS